MEIPHWKIVSIGIAFLLLLLASSIFLGKFLPQSEIQLKILQFGNYWIGFLIYVISFILVCDLIWLLRSLLAFKWSWMGGPLIRTKTGVILLAVLVLGGSFLSTLYGAVHAKKIKTSFHDITINKQVDDLKEMKVVLIADLHLGYSVGSKDMQKMVDRINKQDPDLVVLAGDIFDNEYGALDDPKHLSETLHQIQSKYGTYAVYGNHDVKETLVAGFSIGASKKALRDPRMDELKEYDKAGVDVLFSGHTHAGQFFPLTIVQPFAWKNYWGVKQIGDMYSIVTSGVGVYGPNIRVGTDSEIMVVTVHFK